MAKNKEEKRITITEDGIQSASKTLKDGKEISYRMEEISNGWILTKETYNPNAKKDEDRWKTEKTYTEEKPGLIDEFPDLEDFVL